MSWNDAQAFIARLNTTAPGLDLTLPSEAQWEYACRAGTTTPFSFGDQIDPARVNYDGGFPYSRGAKGLDRAKTVDVASLPPNPWGLHEMHGNVWEWCQDLFHHDYRGAPPDGTAWLDSGVQRRGESNEDSAERVLRGGSWLGHARCCRSACRSSDDPAGRFDFIGFRCARVQA